MTANQPTCMGCFTYPPNLWNQPPMAPVFNENNPFASVPFVPYGHIYPGLTEEEKKILESLATAWNEFVKLDHKHADDNNEFRHAIHQAQQMIALRVARRIDTHIWTQPEATHGNDNTNENRSGTSE